MRWHLRRFALEAARWPEVVAGGAGALIHALVHRLGQVRRLAHTPGGQQITSRKETKSKAVVPNNFLEESIVKDF